MEFMEGIGYGSIFLIIGTFVAISILGIGYLIGKYRKKK